ncbi:hypothetical protein WMY93_023704 [Mugilogobius chulae]|uniref:F-box domain-containing protein n=1 Tax=Mugilogobius chulae TaxID=88201 RepID=A0AAW0N6E6_9GOBI
MAVCARLCGVGQSRRCRRRQRHNQQDQCSDSDMDEEEEERIVALRHSDVCGGPESACTVTAGPTDRAGGPQHPQALSDLPPELLVEIFSMLPGTVLPNVALVCKKFRQILNTETVWRRRCVEEFGMKEDLRKMEVGAVSSRDLYVKLCFMLQSIHYILSGPLLANESYSIHLTFGPYRGYADLFLKTCLLKHIPPQQTKQSSMGRPMIRRACQLFVRRILVSVWVEMQYVYMAAMPSPYADKQSPYHFQDRMPGRAKWKGRCRHDDERTATLSYLIHIQFDYIQSLYKVSIINTNNCLTYRRIYLPPPMPSALLQPGLFKGTYGSHGLEIVMLSFHGTSARATKLTGDPNVPAGQLTLDVDLNRPVVLPDLERQRNIEELSRLVLGVHAEVEREIEQQAKGASSAASGSTEEGANSQPGPSSSSNPPELLPFVLPLGVMARNEVYPRTCRKCFYGTGLIAGHGFTSPERTPGLFVLFDQDRFGFIWLELKSFSLYSRLTDHLPHAQAPNMERFEAMLRNMQSWTS